MEDKWELQKQKFNEQYREYLASGGYKTRDEWFLEKAHYFSETFSSMSKFDPTDEDFENLKNE